MIARIWHGSTKPENAEAYESHLKPELLPGLSEKKGFRRSYLLRRVVGDEIEFITIILFDSLDDLRWVAGEDYERAVIPADRLPLLSRYDATAAHFEVVTRVDGVRSRLRSNPPPCFDRADRELPDSDEPGRVSCPPTGAANVVRLRRLRRSLGCAEC